MTMRTGKLMGAIFAVAVVGLVLGSASEARADHYYSGGYSRGYSYYRPAYTCYSTPTCYAPRPVYYCEPRPVYYSPPVYCAPRPVYYSPPVYYSRPSYSYGGYYSNSGFSVGGSYNRGGYGRDGGSFYFNYRR